MTGAVVAPPPPLVRLLRVRLIRGSWVVALARQALVRGRGSPPSMPSTGYRGVERLGVQIGADPAVRQGEGTDSSGGISHETRRA